MASSHALWATRRVPPNQSIEFETKSGILRATTLPRDPSWIELDFPIEPPHPLPDGKASSEYNVVKRALGCNDDDILYIGR